jgi:hypothetical protein
MKLDQVTLHRGTRTLPTSQAFANRPTAIVRVETVARLDEPMKLVAGTAEGTAWALQAASEPLRELTNRTEHILPQEPRTAL